MQSKKWSLQYLAYIRQRTKQARRKSIIDALPQLAVASRQWCECSHGSNGQFEKPEEWRHTHNEYILGPGNKVYEGNIMTRLAPPKKSFLILYKRQYSLFKWPAHNSTPAVSTKWSGVSELYSTIIQDSDEKGVEAKRKLDHPVAEKDCCFSLWVSREALAHAHHLTWLVLKTNFVPRVKLSVTIIRFFSEGLQCTRKLKEESGNLVKM